MVFMFDNVEVTSIAPDLGGMSIRRGLAFEGAL